MHSNATCASSTVSGTTSRSLSPSLTLAADIFTGCVPFEGDTPKIVGFCVSLMPGFIMGMLREANGNDFSPSTGDSLMQIKRASARYSDMLRKLE